MARRKLERPHLVVAPELPPPEPDIESAVGVLLPPAPPAPALDAPPKLPAPAPSTAAPNRTANLSASIDAAIRDRIDAIAYEQKLGKTAIVEGALSMLFEGRTNAQVADELRARGHAFRRRS
jgi:hypothetical protein